jgi:hypothetical protein
VQGREVAGSEKVAAARVRVGDGRQVGRTGDGGSK